MAKTYIVTDNIGNSYTTKNLKSFCKERDISYKVLLLFLNKGKIPLSNRKYAIQKIKLANWQITDKI